MIPTQALQHRVGGGQRHIYICAMASSHPKVFHSCLGWVGLSQSQYKWICLASNSLCSPSWLILTGTSCPQYRYSSTELYILLSLKNFFLNLSFLPFFSFFVSVQCLRTCVEVRKQPSEVSSLLLPPGLWK